MDWTLAKSFLTVAETGSLSAAARVLGVSQPTLGRQVKELEAQLGAELFHRAPRGLTLTQTGASIVSAARTMRDAAMQMETSAAGQKQSLDGTVRITASIVISSYHLPKIIAEMRRVEPQIAIELVPSDESHNLLYREADIAIRMYRPKQLDLITQNLGDIRLGVFAAKSYIARRGLPLSVADLPHHDFVGYDKSTAILDGMNQAGLGLSRDFFKVRCDDSIAYWELVKAGCGIGFSQAEIGERDPDLIPLDFGFPLPKLPVWLTAHEAMRDTPRIRRVWDLLAKGLLPLVS